jgi:fibronectin-binding autotransporter adhesin
MEFWSRGSTVKGPRHHRSGGAVARRLAVLLLLALATSMGTGGVKPAYAATTITVDCTTDPSALASALASASDGDTLAIQGTCNGTFEIAHSLTLAGSGGATLDGQGAGTVLTVDSGMTVDVSDLTVTGGTGPNGGAGGIVNEGALTLRDSTVSGNIAGINGGGAGILNTFGATLTLNSSTISGNSGGSSGGGVLNYGALALADSKVSGNSTGGPDTAGNGGGIYIQAGTVTIETSTITGNTAHNGGGGIYSVSTLTINDSTIDGNTASFGGGGGIYNVGSVVTVEDSTITGNTAPAGGGIEDNAGGTFTMTNTTVADNSASSGGGIFDLFGAPETLNYSTIVGNSASSSGGGIFNFFNLSGAAETLNGSLIAGNPGGNCVVSSGPPSSILDGGYNLDDGTSCDFSAANHSLSTTDPMVDSAGLADNGGPTQTVALLSGSPAIDAIPPGVNGCGTTITSDQRGLSRPQGPGCDIGAFEAVPSGADLSITKSSAPNPVLSGNRLTYTLTVTNNGPTGATRVTVTDPLLGNVHFDSVGSSQGSCTRSTAKPAPKDGTVTCSLGNLANGASARITIVVTTTTPGTLTNTATVRGNEADPTLPNNSATATTTVIGT